jgi:hypothetical protein
MHAGRNITGPTATPSVLERKASDFGGGRMGGGGGGMEPRSQQVTGVGMRDEEGTKEGRAREKPQEVGSLIGQAAERIEESSDGWGVSGGGGQFVKSPLSQLPHQFEVGKSLLGSEGKETRRDWLTGEDSLSPSATLLNPVKPISPSPVPTSAAPSSSSVSSKPAPPVKPHQTEHHRLLSLQNFFNARSILYASSR